MSKKWLAFIGLVICQFSISASAEVIRDYYAEPGLNPFKETLNQNFSEQIDPFSGTLQLGYMDLLIPGNGGLDIKIYRSYTSLQDRTSPGEIVGARDTTGVGWTMHQGRIVLQKADELKMCKQGVWLETADDNPVIELPDGRRERLFFYTDQNTAYLVSKNRWKARCEIGKKGMIVTAPDGTEYFMDQREDSNDGTVNILSFYTSQIKDLNGNTINISYKTGYGFTYIDTISFNQNTPSVEFIYSGEATGDIMLDKITANGQVWDYNYQAVAGTWYHLTEVIRPDNRKWQYSYHPLYSGSGQAGSYSLNKVTYPDGGTITYTYAPVDFDSTGPGGPTTVIDTKVTGGSGIVSGTWTFNFEPASTIGIDFDQTTIIAPNGKYVYEHFGYDSKDVAPGTVWKIGLLRKKEIYATDNTLLHTETNTWGSQIISNENYKHRRVAEDPSTFSPLLQQTVVTRDGTSYTTDYLNYDIYGNVGRVVQTANTKVASDFEAKVSDYIYYIDTAKWIVNQVKDDTTSTGMVDTAGNLFSVFPAGKVERLFYPATGLLQRETKFGLVNGALTPNGTSTNYTYTTEGDLFTVTDANTHQTKLENYYRGIARKETHPINAAASQFITITREVNPTGTVKSQTNGRLKKTSFAYDDLNRLTGITYPKQGSEPVLISWSGSGKTLTRGAYTEVVSVDGFGMQTGVTRIDTVRNETESTAISYDALGQKVFESYPYSASYGTATTGTNFTYDTLGRVKTMTHPDASSRLYTYLAGNKVDVTNERNIKTTYQYRSYGGPDQQIVVNIQSPEAINTNISRNVFGQITSVNQGGKIRSYAYNQNYYLSSITQPEIGDTVFGRDNVGNMTSKTVGTSGNTIYTYDESNRLTNINYPGATPDVIYIYDANNNVKSINNGVSLREYNYDDHDNRIENKLTVDGVVLTTNYAFNNLDFLDTITYPSLKKVMYSPDALGRPRMANPYATDVSYFPGGSQKSVSFANGVVTSKTLDQRRRVEKIQTGQVVDLNYTYDGLGNVESITNEVDPAYSISNMVYDGVNRLKNATSIWGLASYNYDTRGNLLDKTLGTTNLTYNYHATNERLLSTSGLATNNFVYDTYGNISSNGTQTYTYNDAGDLTSVTTPSVTLANTYDGNNIRVKASKSGKTTYYAYTDHNQLGEYEPTGEMRKEYIYLGSQQIAVLATVPDDPVSITVTTPDANNNYAVSWTSIVGITHYQLLETTSQSCSDGTIVYSGVNANYNVANQTDGTFYYCVRACNGSNCSNYTFSGASCAVAGSTAAPCLPESITVPSSNTTGTYTLNWGAATGSVSHYELQQSQFSDFTGAVTVYSGTGLTTQITVDPAQCGASCNYYYRIRACNNVACGLYLEADNFISVDIPVPPSPTQFNVPTANVTGTGNFTLSWTMPANPGPVTHYEVEEALNSDFSDSRKVYSGAAQNVDISGKIDDIYYYRVRACNTSICSSYTVGANPVTVSGSPILAAVMSIITNFLLN